MGYVIVIYCSFSDYFVCTFSNIFLWLKLTLSKYVQTQNGLIFLAVTLHYTEIFSMSCASFYTHSPKILPDIFLCFRKPWSPY